MIGQDYNSVRYYFVLNLSISMPCCIVFFIIKYLNTMEIQFKVLIPNCWIASRAKSVVVFDVNEILLDILKEEQKVPLNFTVWSFA